MWPHEVDLGAFQPQTSLTGRRRPACLCRPLSTRHHLCHVLGRANSADTGSICTHTSPILDGSPGSKRPQDPLAIPLLHAFAKTMFSA